MSEANAYAVIQHGKVVVDTVSSTKRAAMVNALVCIDGQRVFATASDEAIEDNFRFVAQHCGLSIEQVAIAPLPSPPSSTEEEKSPSQHTTREVT